MTLDMRHRHATSCHREQTLGPSGTTSRNYAVHWVISNYVRFLSRWSMHSQMHAERHPTIGSTGLHHRNSSGTWQMVCCCVRHCLSLTWTAIAPGSPARFHVPNETHFAFEDTDVALQEWWVNSHDFWGWWVSRHSRLVDSCWLHIWLLDSGVFAHKGSKGLPVRVTTRLSSWTKRTNDPSTPMCCLECFGGDWQLNYI